VRGHVYRRGETWTYVVDVGRDPATGRRRMRSKGGFATKREAERTVAETLQALAVGTYVNPDPVTLLD
jgi:hypothetical protein